MPVLETPVVGIVGPCGAGKSSLVAGLAANGFRCRHIAQEHSYVPAMWKLIAAPDVLIFLDASFETCTQRRALAWRPSDYQEQLRRLAHAREHAALIVKTDHLSKVQVLEQSLAFLAKTDSRRQGEG